VTSLCRAISPTDILGAVPSHPADKPVREYDGRVYLERVLHGEAASAAAKSIPLLFENSRYSSAAMQRYAEMENLRRSRLREAVPRDLAPSGGQSAWFGKIDHQVGALCRFLSAWGSYGVVASALYRRGRAISIRPRLIVCHDMVALAAGIKLKKLFGCPVLYDSHEFWPEADLLAPAWQQRLVSWLERKLVRRADVVIAVTPHLARHMEKRYGIQNVVSVPNAAPRPAPDRRIERRPISPPIRFLFQGQAARGRGIEHLLEAWRMVDSNAAVLALRCPENEFLASLRTRYRGLIEQRKVVMLPAVGESDLISAASTADVGIIPYSGSNLNHEMGCPNKLSQYMQAGLAILASKTAFVADVLERYGCGRTYEAGAPASIRGIIDAWSRKPAALQAMKTKALEAVESEFNWESQSIQYSLAIRDLWNRADSLTARTAERKGTDRA
jgi:glycosyltransferase involved in cell wall biosynthesis